jgi:probable F420-dependent oxidoreductase
MKIDSFGYDSSAKQARTAAVEAERFGFDAWWAPETQADPFVSCAVAAEGTEQIELATGVAVAFARNPMTVALQANDLQAVSGGRFILGLGSQIKPHITSRYSMPWSKPAARMREFILAIRAIWNTWASDARLEFRGDFYTHTLMTPFFNPGPNPDGNPQIILAAVGPLMTEVAGEVADGVLLHRFCTERYLRDTTIPALERGAARAGRSLDGFEINVPGFVVARDTEEEIGESVELVRQQIGFYGSTPAYRPVLDAHGWGELQDELHALTKREAWDQLASVIDDEMLHAFAVIGTPEHTADEVRRRYGDVATRISLTLPERADPGRWAPVLDRLRATVPAA